MRKCEFGAGVRGLVEERGLGRGKVQRAGSQDASSSCNQDASSSSAHYNLRLPMASIIAARRLIIT